MLEEGDTVVFVNGRKVAENTGIDYRVKIGSSFEEENPKFVGTIYDLVSVLPDTRTIEYWIASGDGYDVVLFESIVSVDHLDDRTEFIAENVEETHTETSPGPDVDDSRPVRLDLDVADIEDQ